MRLLRTLVRRPCPGVRGFQRCQGRIIAVAVQAQDRGNAVWSGIDMREGVAEKRWLELRSRHLMAPEDTTTPYCVPRPGSRMSLRGHAPGSPAVVSSARAAASVHRFPFGRLCKSAYLQSSRSLTIARQCRAATQPLLPLFKLCDARPNLGGSPVNGLGRVLHTLPRYCFFL